MYIDISVAVHQLEKEALIKGVPIGQALDIEIPPPRPKRKPVNPYPRKTVAGTPTPVVGGKDGKLYAPDSSLCESKQTLGQEKEPLLEVLSPLQFLFFIASYFF